MLRKVQNYIQKQQLLTSDKPIIVGVSGGTDSVALLHILISLGYNCIVAHCNFQLRMEESIRDYYFVRKLAIQLKMPFYSVDFQTAEYAKQHKISIEMAARDLRYEWFDELLQKLGAQAIAVAHHADDSIETLLMNLVRGTGLRGLTGIPPRNKNVVRPLLCCSRMELEEYLVEHGLDHVEDSTNKANTYLRNKFRNEILPLLIEINPTARENLYHSIENLTGNLDIYQQSIDRIHELVVDKKEDSIFMNIALLQQQIHIPTVMHELLSPYGFSSSTIEQITSCLEGESGKVFYSNTHRLVKDRKCLIISAKGEHKNNIYYISQDQTALKEPINLTINKLALTPDFKLSKLPNLIQIDAQKVTFPLQLRHWRDGDWFLPFGMSQRKKISDFFIDVKLSLDEKEACWLLASGDDIVWVVGYRLNNRFRITNDTKEVLEIKIETI